MNKVADDILMHYGVLRRSGRYPWGSGENPYQHSGDFLSRIEELKKKGMTKTEISKDFGLSSTEFRVQESLANHERKALDRATIRSLREKGMSYNAIAQKIGYPNESSVRSLLNEASEARMNKAMNTAKFLKEKCDEKGMIHVGKGVERELNISKEKMKEALYILEREGYEVYGAGVPQVTNPGKQSNMTVLCPPGTEYGDIYKFKKGELNIHSVNEYISHDDGETFVKFEYPKSMDSKRVKINYAEDGGTNKDGLIEIRRNVQDLSLGESHYAQVRILVDNNKYMKGMAIYSDDIPKGYDVVFNTNKSKDTPKEKVFKDITNDPTNPFGSLIKEKGGQSYWYDKEGNKHLSLINKRADEGDWSDWKDALPSQFLAKQNKSLIEKQLNLAVADKHSEYDEICSLNNPTIKKVMLKAFADDCDAAAVHLKAAALPRQKHQVIMPITTMKDNEVYAPNYKDGEKVALIRYPHGGTFEIPILTVNNKHADAKKILGNVPADVVGINKKVADRLSGADFDGDSVMVIPTGGKVKITSTPPLKGLEGFDHKMEYPYYEGMRIMNNTQTEMGKISNLITDMTLKGADPAELARAVRHSMVVIDAEKHKLDYKKSYADNGIAALEKRYKSRVDDEGKVSKGASTLISRAGSQVDVIKRQGSPKINQPGKDWYDPKRPEGALIWTEADKHTYVDSKGKLKNRTQRSTQMAETDDARTLSSGTPQEELYASYANKMKALANESRKEMLKTGNIKYSSSANAVYKEEVATLNAKLNVALKNAPREMQAQLIANSVVEAKKQSNPNLTKKEIGKLQQQELKAARASVGAKRQPIPITDREWEAIQAGAISESKLYQIINHVDADVLKQRATPRTTTALSDAKINKIAAMKLSGYTTAQIAEMLNVSPSTVSKYLKQ